MRCKTLDCPRILVVALSATMIVLLAGCEGPRDARVGSFEEVTYVMSSTPAYVEVWGRSPLNDLVFPRQPTIATDQMMADVAQQHCQRYGKNARLSHTRHALGARYSTFNCV